MVNDLSSLISCIQDDFKEVFGDLSDYELSIIEKSIREPFVRSFVSSNSMSDHIQSMISNLSDLNYFRNKLVSLSYKLGTAYRVEYDKQFTILTRAGRPSKQAIDSEIHYSHPELAHQRDTLEKYNNLMIYLDSQIELIKMSIRNYESQRYHS